jgi:polyhydroxybutyrate depolymerase
VAIRALAVAFVVALLAPLGGRADTRPIIVYRPDGLSRSTKVPLVIVLHARSGQPSGMEQTTGLNGFADANGFVVAYLKSAGDGWDSASWSATDDLDYISSEIDQLTASQNIDPARVYVIGLSSGAYMAYRVACELSTKVTAIGEVAGGMATVDLPSCRPSQPVSVIAVHGDADTTVPLEGRGKLAPLASTLARWSRIDRCSRSTSADSSGVTTEVWSGCANGTAIDFVLIHGEQHDWPETIDTASVLWSFFAQHRAPAALKIISARRSGRRITVTVRVAASGTVTARVKTSVARTVGSGTLKLRLTAPAGARPPYRLTVTLTSARGARTTLSTTIR